MKKYIAILFACVSFCACEDFLTQENPNKIESEYYFKDESSLEIYANGLTRSFATGIKNFVNGDKNADTHAWDGAAAYFKDNYSASDASNWGTSNWSQLRSINFYLDNMRKADAPEAVLNHYEGVGRFFRALFYIDKVQTFGAVPWYDTSIDATDREALFKDRDNREFVASKILEDLDYACTYCLTSDKYRVRASYIHRYVALALKARFCLYEGTMRKYHAVDPSTGRRTRAGSISASASRPARRSWATASINSRTTLRSGRRSIATCSPTPMPAASIPTNSSGRATTTSI